MVPLPPPVRRPAAARAAPHRAGDRSRRCTARPPQWYERARRRRRGDPPRAGRRRLAARRAPARRQLHRASSSTAAWRRCARCSTPSRADAPRPRPELALAFARGAALRRPASTRARAYIAVAERLRRQRPGRAARRASSCSWQRATLVAGAPPRRPRRGAGGDALRGGRARRPARRRRRARQRPSRRRADEPRHRRAVVARDCDDARRHLEEALALARRIGRPYLEIGCLAHLALAAPLGGGSRSPLALRAAASRRSRSPRRTAGRTIRVIAPALAVSAVVLAWLGPLRRGRALAASARERALRPEGEPDTELMLHHAPGLLRLAQRRLRRRAGRLRRGRQRMQALLAGEHVLSVERRSRVAAGAGPDGRHGRRARRRSRDIGAARARPRGQCASPPPPSHLADGDARGGARRPSRR